MSNQEIKIITKIIREISLFFLIHGHKELTIETRLESEVTLFIATIKHPKDNLLDKMKEKINRERELEVETYGWELVGDIDESSELEIVSLLIDDMTVEKKENHTVITLRRTNRYKPKRK